MSLPPDFSADAGPVRPATCATAEDPMPLAPVEPDAGDCCGEGCVPCVFDRYEQALERYREALAAWQRRHPDAGSQPANG